MYDQRPTKKTNKTRILKGGHGYDPSESKEMQAIFYARGPAFKKGATIEPFESVNVYPLLAHLLGIKPRPNNGSLSIFEHILTSDSKGDWYSLNGEGRPALFWLCLPVLAIGVMCVLLRLIRKGKFRYTKLPRDVL